MEKSHTTHYNKNIRTKKCSVFEMEEIEKMKAFIFDLDGVIVFTDKFHYQAWKKMAGWLHKKMQTPVDKKV